MFKNYQQGKEKLSVIKGDVKGHHDEHKGLLKGAKARMQHSSDRAKEKHFGNIGRKK